MRKKMNLYSQPAFAHHANRADQTWWTKDAVLAGLVLGLSGLDAVTLYTVFDAVMYQSMYIGIILTVGCAISLNFIPLIMARFIHYYRYHINGVRVWMIAAMGAVFLLLFSATFYLRWETRDIGFGGAESTMVDTTGQALGIASTDSDSKEAVAITILLGILPGVTSAINLALGYFNDDPVKRKLQTMKVELSKLRAHQDVMLAARSELDQDWYTRLKELDEERFQAACDVIRGSSEQIRTLARLELAKKLGDPDSISALTEPKLADENITKEDA